MTEVEKTTGNTGNLWLKMLVLAIVLGVLGGIAGGWISGIVLMVPLAVGLVAADWMLKRWKGWGYPAALATGSLTGLVAGRLAESGVFSLFHVAPGYATAGGVTYGFLLYAGWLIGRGFRLPWPERLLILILLAPWAFCVRMSFLFVIPGMKEKILLASFANTVFFATGFFLLTLLVRGEKKAFQAALASPESLRYGGRYVDGSFLLQ